MLLCNLHSIACKKTPRSPKPIPSFPPGERRFGDNQWTIKETSQKSAQGNGTKYGTITRKFDQDS